MKPDEPETDPQLPSERPTVTHRLEPAASSTRVVPARYETTGQIGRGGMGEVLLARDRHVGREVAVKRMHGDAATEDHVRRFMREAAIQARLDHPAIVPVYDVGRDPDGSPYFVMKRLMGTTLAQILGDPMLAAKHSRQHLLRALVEICLAIEFAHARGVIHRDLKPSNLLLGDFGEVYVLDWGVAKLLTDSDIEFLDVMVHGTDETIAGTSIGTPGFMAPEQIHAESDIDGRADVYALGCVLFEILTAPRRVRRTEVKPLHPSEWVPEGTVPPELDELCAAATAVERDQRVATARELGERIQQYLDGDRDVVLRKRIAREHLARARKAFDALDDDAQRVVAMREAGMALGLDPTLPGAAELVGRLMIEPPRTMPREVEVTIEEDERATNRNQARIGFGLCFGYLGFVPFLMGYESPAFPLGFLALIALNCALIWRQAYKKRRLRIVDDKFTMVIATALLVAAIARAFSPIFLAPGLAGLTTSALVNTPLYSRARTAIALVLAMFAAVFVPWVCEATGALSPTFAVTDQGPVLYHAHLYGSAALRTAGLVGFVVAVIGAGAAITYFVRKAERTTRRQLHLQAWHLRQLVPPLERT